MIFRKDFFITNGQKIEDHYRFDEKDTLGTGSFGQVVLGVQISTQIERAIKIIQKEDIEDQLNFVNEIDILKTLDHPNIIKLYETFEDQDRVFLIFELCHGGELFNAILERGHFNENEARDIFHTIMKALHHCHKSGICHRDLKPENFLLAQKGDLNSVKMIDFGLSAYFKPKHQKLPRLRESFKGSMQPQSHNPKRQPLIRHFSTFVGTNFYIAPEVLQGNYDEQCDIWSAGVVLYVLLIGYPPFRGNTEWELMIAIKNGVYDLSSRDWSYISNSAKHLISKMLCPKKRRLSAEEVLRHPWLAERERIPSNSQLQVSMLRDYMNAS